MNIALAQTMTEAEASKLTERIRLTAHNYAESRQKLQELVSEAKDGNAHVALGYASWTAYLADVLGEEPMRLARGERQEMVQMLSAEGMSTRAIAPIVGADRKTVIKDVRQVVHSGPPDPNTHEGVGSTDTLYAESTSPTHVVGMDGKRYARPEPRPERRPGLPDQFRAVSTDLWKRSIRLGELQQDDRFTTNRKQIALLTAPEIHHTLREIVQFAEQVAPLAAAATEKTRDLWVAGLTEWAKVLERLVETITEGDQ